MIMRMSNDNLSHFDFSTTNTSTNTSSTTTNSRLDTHRPEIEVMIARRLFHSTCSVRRNPYYFYDLAAKQRTSSSGQSFDPARPFKSEGLGKAAQVFGEMGSRILAKAEAEKKARVIAGVKVPGKPEEPTNCCMSGCINCVWESYKDELEEWRQLRNLAKQKLCTAEYADRPWPADFGKEPPRATGAKVELEDDTWSEVDMGIRVFVETEKKIREKKQKKKIQLASGLSTSPSSDGLHQLASAR